MARHDSDVWETDNISKRVSRSLFQEFAFAIINNAAIEDLAKVLQLK